MPSGHFLKPKVSLRIPVSRWNFHIPIFLCKSISLNNKLQFSYSLDFSQNVCLTSAMFYQRFGNPMILIIPRLAYTEPLTLLSSSALVSIVTVFLPLLSLSCDEDSPFSIKKQCKMLVKVRDYRYFTSMHFIWPTL